MKTFLAIALACFCFISAHAAGVTVITHGLNGNVDGWVTNMAGKITGYNRFPGTNYSFYKIYFVPNGSGYNAAWSRLRGAPPSLTDSGEILIAFDWSQLSDGNSYNTYQIASVLDAVLRSTNFIPELNGHALCELPIHLVGHSRGGSLMCETSRLLGTNGVWVDHLTTLDPHPLNDPNFPLDFFLYNAVDAPCATYQNILFHDNYWQNSSYPINGEPVSGAYVRKLTSFSGGYSSAHSDVHLWYHGTLDLITPTSDSEAPITSTERNSWWAAYENHGTNAGFIYSRIGNGDRTAYFPPGLPGDPIIRDGYNQYWDLGAGGLNTNRTLLSANNGTWPDIIKLNVTGTNVVVQNDPVGVKMYYQYGGPSNLTAQIYFDPDCNPYNSNSIPALSLQPPATGTGTVFYYPGLGLATTNVAPRSYAVYARISDGTHVRYLYAPETVTILSIPQSPVLDIVKSGPAQFIIGVNGVAGQKMTLQASVDLQGWSSLATNTLTTSRWTYTNSLPFARQFYRAILGQ